MTKESRRRFAVVDWRFWTASCLVGFTAGLFAGMSESPVGTALVGGIFGLLGGGGIYGLLTRAWKDQGSSSSTSEREDPWEMLSPVALATSLFCIFAIVGVALGIGLREGWIVPQPENRTATLIPIAQDGKDLLPRQQLKLLILQSELASLGVPVEANNHFVRSFIETGKDDQREGFNEDKSLRDLKRKTQDLKETVDRAFEALSTKNVRKLPPDKLKDSAEIEDDDDAPLRLKSVGEINYGDVMNAYVFLEKARPFADEVKNYIEAASMPELSAILDLISRYREANMAQPSAGRLSPLVNRKKLWGSEPERKAGIKH